MSSANEKSLLSEISLLRLGFNSQCIEPRQEAEPFSAFYMLDLPL